MVVTQDAGGGTGEIWVKGCKLEVRRGINSGDIVHKISLSRLKK